MIEKILRKQSYPNWRSSPLDHSWGKYSNPSDRCDCVVTPSHLLAFSSFTVFFPEDYADEVWSWWCCGSRAIRTQAVQLVAMVERGYLFMEEGQWPTLLYKCSEVCSITDKSDGQFGQSGLNERYPSFIFLISDTSVETKAGSKLSAPAPDATATTRDKRSFFSRQSLPKWWKSDEDLVSHNRCKTPPPSLLVLE